MSASSKEGLFAVCGSFIGLSTIAVSLRFYARKYQKVNLGLDDWTALFGVVTYVAAAALGIELAVLGQFGYGHLAPAQAKARIETGFLLAVAYDWLNLNTLACVKLSALFMYRRVFAVDRNGWFNRVILATVAIIAMWYITSDFLSLYQCRTHFSAPWEGEYAKYCDLNPVWAQELAITDFILDFWVLLLPTYSIYKLHATLARRLSIFGVFLLAFVGLGASIARMVFFISIKAPGTVVLYIGLLESGMSITVVNLPSIYYLCSSVIPDQVANSLRSMRNLASFHSSRSRNQSNLPVPEANQQDQAPITNLAVQPKSSWSIHASSISHGNSTDIEANRPQSLEMHHIDGSQHGNSVHDLPRNAIRVENGVEVRRDRIDPSEDR